MSKNLLQNFDRTGDLRWYYTENNKIPYHFSMKLGYKNKRFK